MTRSAPCYHDRQSLLAYIDDLGEEPPVLGSDGWRRRRSHILSNMQQVMGDLPGPGRRVPLDVEIEEEETFAASRRKRITFGVEDGDRVPSYLFVPTDLKRRAPAILCLHQTTKMGKGEPAGLGGKEDLHYAKELGLRGYVTLAPDYPNYGGYSFDAYAHGYASATMKGIWNHMRAVDLLQSLPGVDGDRIGCIGHSLGGHNALFVAAFDERIRAVVTSCGFTSFPKYKGGDLSGWSHGGYMPRIADRYGNDPARTPFDFTEILGVMAPRPVFINAPVGDDNFDVSGVRDCVQAAQSIYALLGASDRLQAVYPDCGHDFPRDAREKAYGFLERML